MSVENSFVILLSCCLPDRKEQLWLRFSIKNHVFLALHTEEQKDHDAADQTKPEALLTWTETLKSRSPPEGGALYTRLDGALVFSPGFGH